MVTGGALTKAIEIGNDLRVGAVGKTRMGKTFLMERLLAKQPRVIAVDTKGDVAWKGYYLAKRADAALVGNAIKEGNQYRVIYRVPEGQDIPDGWFTRAMRLLHDMGGGIIYVDEMPQLVTASTMRRDLRDVFRVGGGLGVGLWWSAQEAVGVHNTALRMSERLFLFYNQGASDRDKLIGTVGDMGEATKDLDKFHFFQYETSEIYDPDAIPIYKAVA